MKKYGLFFLIALVFCFAGCSMKADEKPGNVDTKPCIIVEEVKYWEKGQPVEELPEGYACIGELSKEEAQLLTGLTGCKIYKAEGKQDLYLYQECGTVVGDTMDMTKLRWAYQRWTPSWFLENQ